MTLNKPYTNKEYFDLAVYANENTMKIVDCGDYLEAIPQYSEEELAQMEATRIANLSMTRGDFFRAIFKAKGIKREALRAMIESATLDGFTEDDRELALIDFDEGLNFNRGNELIELLCQNSDISSDQMTAFFETGDYTELTKIEEVAESEESIEESSEVSDG